MKKIVIAIATLLITIPAFAASRHQGHHDVAVAAPEAAYANPVYGYRCGPGPRVGAFATAPWVPCEPMMKTDQGPTYIVRTPKHYPMPNEGVKLMDPDRATW